MPSIVVDLLTEDPELRRLCEQYWEQDGDGEFVLRVADLVLPEGVRRHQVAEVVRQYSRASDPTRTCTACGLPEVLRSRADVVDRRRRTRAVTCDACAQEQEQERAQKQRELGLERAEVLNERFSRSTTACGAAVIPWMSLRHASLLLAAIRVGADDELKTILPASTWAKQISPRGMWDLEILGELFEAGLLQIYERSDQGAFDWESGKPDRFWKDRVQWCVAAVGQRRDIASMAVALETVIEAPDRWPAAWYLELEPLWLEVAEREVLAYLDVQVSEHHLPLTMGPRLRHVVSQALKSFSAGQLFYFSWKAARDAAAFYQRERVTAKHAGNIVPGAIERSAERALAEGWDISSYRRDRRSPETEWTALLANRVFGAGYALLELRLSDVRRRAEPVREAITRIAARIKLDEAEVTEALSGVPLSLQRLSAMTDSGESTDLSDLALMLGCTPPDGDDEKNGDAEVAPQAVPSCSPPQDAPSGPPKSKRRAKKRGKKRRRR